jgi:uncharacterized protein YkwD
MVQGGKGVWLRPDQTMSDSKMHRWVSPAILASALLFGAATAAPQGGSEDLQDFALRLVNESRAATGLSALSAEPALTRAAQAHAEDMLRRGYFSHISPQGDTALDRYIKSGGGRGKLLAENIAECRNCAAGQDEVGELHRGWMDSPGHRANILSPGIERFGFGIAEASGRVVAVQTFAGPGTAAGAAEGEEGDELDDAGQLRSALEHLNEARRKAGVRPVQGSGALSQALRRSLAANGNEGGGELRLPPVSAILSALPADEGSPVGDAALVAGQCGGCGIRPVAADLAFFMERWLADPNYRSRLLDPRWSELGVVLEADGKGRKRALAILFAPSG